MPYWWQVLEAAADWRCRQLTVVAASQTGKTANAILSVLGHRLGDGPRTPTMLVFPTQKAVTDFSSDRLQRLIETTPSLDSIHEKGQRDARYLKFIGGVPVRLAWAGSATELASHPSGLALVDELDRMARDVGGEGDPLTLVRARLTTYRAHLLVVTSSPTIEDESPIQREWESGSMEMYEWRCFHCQEYHRPVSASLIWDERASPEKAQNSVRYVCPHCGAEHGEADKRKLADTFRWWGYERAKDGTHRPRADGDVLRDHTHRSFWVPGIPSPWLTFGQLARRLCEARMSGEAEVLQGAINTAFGELYTVTGDRPELEEIMACRDQYASGTLPAGVQRVTMGVDVQRDRLYWLIVGWGAEETDLEAWIIEGGEILGNPLFDDVWHELYRLLVDLRYRIQKTIIDTGWDPGTSFVRPYERIKNFCRQYEARGVYPSRGKRKLAIPVLTKREDVRLGGQKIKNAVLVWSIDTTHFKSEFYSRVQVPSGDPRALHLPFDASEDLMRQLTAEELRTTGAGQMFYHCPRHRANHYLDCMVMAYAAAHLMNSEHRLRRRAPGLDLDAAPTKAATPSPAPVAPRPADTRGRRRLARRSLV